MDNGLWTPKTLGIWLAGSVAVSYVATKLPTWARYPIAMGINVGSLAIPLMGGATAFPVHHMSTVMQSVFAFTIPLQISAKLLWNAQEQPKITPGDDRQQENIVVRTAKDLAQHLGSFAWFVMPISRVPANEIKPLVPWLTDIAENVASFVFKSIVQPLMFWKATELALQSVDDNRTMLTALFLLSVIAGTGGTDLLCGIVSLVSFGRLKMMPFNQNCLWPSSLGDLWGKRYNRLISEMLKYTVFTPALRAGYSKSTAGMMAFGMSGVLHCYVAVVAFRTGLVPTMAFFTVHGLAVTAEQVFRKQYFSLPRLVRTAMVAGFMMLTIPLYGGLFIDAYPGWLKINGVVARPWALPIANSIATSIGWPTDSVTNGL